MKRFLWIVIWLIAIAILTALLMRPFIAIAGGYDCWRNTISGNQATQTAIGLDGHYLYSYNIITSDDDAVTLTLYHPDGTALQAITTSAGTSLIEICGGRQ